MMSRNRRTNPYDNMAIVKATYTKSSGAAKAAIRYIEHRPGREGEKVKRELYGRDGSVERGEAYRMIDEAGKGTVFFRFVISPDPVKEDTEKDLLLTEITVQTMQTLEERLQNHVSYVAVEHDDHAPHRHVHVLVSQIRAFFQQAHTLHHARFARLHELAGLLTIQFNETSLLLGVSHFNHLLRVRPNETRRELGNVLVVAPTRGGKGLLATSQLLSWPHSVIVNDIKGELFDQTAGYRSTLGKVYVFDPTGVGNRFDPLRGKYTDLELKSVAKSLLYKPDEGSGEIFTQRATRMLTQLFHAARLEQVSPLRYVGTMINAPLKVVANRLARLSPQLAIRFLDDHIADADFQNKFLLSGWSTLTARLDALLAESLARCFSGNDFTAHELLFSKTPITVYLRWPERDLLVLSPLIRLMWGTLIDELTAAYDAANGVNCRPVLLLIDEAGRTAIPSLADHATTVVGRGISLWIAIQSLSQ